MRQRQYEQQLVWSLGRPGLVRGELRKDDLVIELRVDDADLLEGLDLYRRGLQMRFRPSEGQSVPEDRPGRGNLLRYEVQLL